MNENDLKSKCDDYAIYTKHFHYFLEICRKEAK